MGYVSVKRASKVKKYRRSGRYKRNYPPYVQRTKRDVILPLQRNVRGFPDNIVTIIRYEDIYGLSFNNSAPAVATRTFRMNSINDPDQTGAGHQPLYHDTYASIYQKYTVLGSKLRATFVPNTNPSGPWVIGVLTEGDASISATITTLLENSNAVSDMIPGPIGGPSKKMLTGTYSPERDLGTSADDDTVGASFGSNPSLQWYGSIFAYDMSGSGTNYIEVKVEIEYCVRVRGLLDVAGS